MKKLIVEYPYEDTQEWEWNSGAQKRFHLDQIDIELLEEGKLIWRGATAFSLEERED